VTGRLAPRAPRPTARLRFRRASRDDAAWLARAWADGAYAALHGEARPATPEAAWRLLRERRGAGDWDAVLVLRRGGERVGRGSVQRWDAARRSAEIEVEIPDPSWRGLGLGHEAVAALVAFARDRFGAESLRAHVAAHNAASLALARSMGFRTVRRRLPAPGAPAVFVMVWSAPHGHPGS
jgi:RimJ/RimL family protein N-acetyltransferase